MTLTDAEVATAITNAYAQMKNFNIVRKGVKIVIEKGNALNRRPNNISDVTKFKSTDFAQRNGVDIVYRMTVEDVVTGLPKGMITIDADGNCDLKFKSLNIEADTFTTTTPLVELVTDGGNWDEIIVVAEDLDGLNWEEDVPPAARVVYDGETW
jgi:hypothetical protein